MKLVAILQIASLIAVTTAKEWVYRGEDYFVAMGCKNGVDASVQYCKKPEAVKKYTCICSNKYALTSWMDCAAQYYDTDLEKVAEQVVDLCNQSGGLNDTMTVSNLTATYEKYKSQIVNIDTTSNFNTTRPKVPVTGETIFKNAQHAYTANRNRWGNVNVSHFLGIAFVAVFGSILIAAGIINWILRLSPSTTNKCTGKFFNFIRKNYVLGLFGKHLHAAKFSGIIPDRVESFLIASMFIFSMLSCCIIGFYYKEGDTVFANYQAGTSRYWGDRSGIFLSYQLPLVFIFPGRNNFFQYITRWKYGRFVSLHKWLARTVMMEVFIHSFAMASQTYALQRSGGR